MCECVSEYGACVCEKFASFFEHKHNFNLTDKKLRTDQKKLLKTVLTKISNFEVPLKI